MKTSSVKPSSLPLNNHNVHNSTTKHFHTHTTSRLGSDYTSGTKGPKSDSVGVWPSLQMSEITPSTIIRWELTNATTARLAWCNSARVSSNSRQSLLTASLRPCGTRHRGSPRVTRVLGCGYSTRFGPMPRRLAWRFPHPPSHCKRSSCLYTFQAPPLLLLLRCRAADQGLLASSRNHDPWRPV